MTTMMKKQPLAATKLLFVVAILSFLLLDDGTFVVQTNALLLVPPPAVVHTACGFVAGSAGAIAAYPIDFVKSQLQTEEGRTKYAGGGFEAAMSIVKEDGIMALYRGVPVQIMGVAPEKTIKLSINEAGRNAIRASLNGNLPIIGEAIAGGFAGMMQVTVTNPLEVVKVRMQTSSMSLKEVMSQLKSLKDLYLGAGPCIVRDTIFSAVLFPTYAHVKLALATSSLVTANNGGGDTASMAMFWANMIAGSIAAAPAAIIATPPDVVKTRMQQSRQDVAFDDPLISKQSSEVKASDVIRDLMEEGGIQIMFSGCFERVVRSAPQFGVTLAVFDVLNSIAIDHGWI